MVVSEVSNLDVPPLRGNPFDSRPVERGRAHEIVGRDDILINWKEHMHSQSPRMLLLAGERGSGRTSLINAISSQTDKHFVGQFWHKEDPVNRALNEISVTFCGHEVPPTMHQKVERLVESLDSETGPLPLIALDYPSEADISSFLPLILPIFQRLRALVVVSLSNTQLLSLNDSVKEAFSEPTLIEPFTSEQIQAVCDIRMRRMAREKWSINPDLLEAIRSRTGGNARSVINILRDLIDEKRGLGCEGTLDGLTNWNAPKVSKPQLPEQDVDESPDSSQDEKHLVPNIHSSDKQEDGSKGEIEDFVTESLPSAVVEYEEEWDQEPDDMWEGAETLPSEEQDEEKELKDPARITDWTAEEGTLISMEEGTEPPQRDKSPRGFSGLASRSRITKDEMPTGPDFSTPIQEPDSNSHSSRTEDRDESETQPHPGVSESLVKSLYTGPSPPEEKRVFHSEGELWTVDSELEETLPEPSDPEEPDPEEPETSDFDHLGVGDSQFPSSKLTNIAPDPVWDSRPMPEEGDLRSLSDAERLVLSIASEREISPSDAEIQARLEVGRPRLSQIYNSLHKSGILSVRKEGRSRLFKLSEAASELLNEA